MRQVALIAEHHPAFAGSFGTPNLIKTLCAAPTHPFAAVVATDTAGPHAIAGPWETIPTLSLLRPRSLLPKWHVGLGLLDNLAFRLQNRRVVHFLQKQRIQRLLVLAANNPRLVLFAVNLPPLWPRDVYIIDDFVEDSHLYRVKKETAKQALDKLVLESARVFTISPVYAADLEREYQRPCQFLPIPIPEANWRITASQPIDRPAQSDSIIIHHSGQIHHLYADALASFIGLLQRLTEIRPIKITLELWGDLKLAQVEQALQVNISENRPNLVIKLCGQAASSVELINQQKRADFLLVVNSFRPELEKQVRCSFSSKVCEYMVSGVPMLVYTPPYASLVTHLGAHHAAYLITTAIPDQALAQLDQIIVNSDKNSVVEAAIRLAKTQHTAETFFRQIVT
jgi:hypothetical protein